MLSEEEWSRNVGTAAFPVSFLHEYAVGLLWDALQNESEVFVKTIDGTKSGNLKEGVDKVVIPDAMQPIGGCIPDLALLDKNLRPVCVIEVVVSSPPTPSKKEKIRQAAGTRRKGRDCSGTERGRVEGAGSSEIRFIKTELVVSLES